MIAYLTGLLKQKSTPLILMDVNGVGYELEVSLACLGQLPDVGSTVTLHTHQIIREDAHLLFGFYQEQERVLFRVLIKLSGVGPKVALAILSTLSLPELILTVQTNRIDTLTRVPGVGKKTAARLLLELKDHLDHLPMVMHEVGDSSETGFCQPESHPLPLSKVVLRETLSALINLGYTQQETAQIVLSLDPEGKTTSMLVREALRRMTSTPETV